MLTKEELLELIHDIESSRAERTVSVNDTDKFCEAVCAFANDMPDSKQNGYLLVGVHDDGRLKRRCRYSGAIAYNNFPWSQDANGQGAQRTEGTKGTEATKETKRTDETKGTKVTEATGETREIGWSLRSLPSLSSFEGGANG